MPEADLPLAADTQKLSRVVLEGEALGRLSPLQEADRAQAVADLSAGNLFSPVGQVGPFALHLSVQEGRLVLDVRDEADRKLMATLLALGLGIAVGWRRGSLVGIATGLGVLMAAALGYVVVFSLSLPM